MNTEVRFAGESTIEALYKFRRYDGEHRAWVRDILVNNRVYFSAATTFNDPFDPRPRYRVVSTSEAVRRFTEWMDGNTKLSLMEKERQASLTRLASMTPEQIELMLSLFNEDLRNSYPMYCLSGSRDNILLWSHYANGHQGMCIHFDHRSAPFSRAREVDYDPLYPTIEWPIGDDKELALRRALLTKSSAWSYEQEFRLIRFPSDAPEPESLLDLRWEGNRAEIPASSVTGVTIGVAMSANDEQEIAAICRDRHLAVHKAHLRPAEYGLNFEQIA